MFIGANREAFNDDAYKNHVGDMRRLIGESDSFVGTYHLFVKEVDRVQLSDQWRTINNYLDPFRLEALNNKYFGIRLWYPMTLALPFYNPLLVEGTLIATVGLDGRQYTVCIYFHTERIG